VTNLIAPATANRWKLGAVVLAIALAIFSVWHFGLRGGLGRLVAGELQSVEVSFMSRNVGPQLPPFTSSDKAGISSLVELLRSAEPHEDHKCMSLGTIELARPPGPPVQVEFLPGHDEAWYEIRFEKQAYRMPRAPFVQTMEKLGVKVPLECL
jgi:hypothetical protein